MQRQLPEQLRQLAAFQEGILTHRQATEGGMTKNAVRSRMKQGHWQRIYPGVYAVFTGTLQQKSLVWAAVLHAGPGAIASHQTAAWLAGLTDSAGSRIHVTIPRSRRFPATPGLVVHSSVRAQQAAHPAACPPQTRVEETVLDLIDCAASFEVAHGWLTRALGRRLSTPAKLRAAVGQRTRLRWRPEVLRALAPDEAGALSWLEYRYLHDVERPHRLPSVARQVRVRRGSRSEYRDVLYEAYLLVVELDGKAAHPGDTRWQDIRRDNAAAADGMVTLRYGWLDVSEHPCKVAAQVPDVLRRRGFAGGGPCSSGCPVPRQTQRRPA
jgi:very-short-patch-repair endonuclease